MEKIKDNIQKLDVCFVAPLPPPYGGIANWTAMMQRILDKEYADSISYNIIDISPQKRVTEGRNIFGRIIGGSLVMYRAARLLKRIIGQKKPDCIHITTSGSMSLIRDWAVLKIARRYKIKTLYHIRFGKVPEYFDKGGIKKHIFRRNANIASIVVAIDKTTYQALEKNGYGHKSRLIPNPVYIDELPKPTREKGRIVSFVGWIIKEKGIEELLSAWYEIESENQALEWTLQLIGPYKKDYKSELEEKYPCKKARFVGEKIHNDALDMVNKGRIFVLPSYSEGFPNALVEAMALKERIIATNVGAITEMLSNGCGHIIGARDKEALKQALINAINCEDDEMSERAYQKAVNNYDIHIILKKYIDEWKS